MLDEVDPEAVWVLMPPQHLYEPVTTALHQGRNVFIEKPLALTTMQARMLAYFAEERSVLTMVGFQRRHIPAVTDFRKRVEARGPIHGATVTFYKATKNLNTHSGFYDGAIDPLTSDGIHAVDNLRWLSGGEVVDVHSVVRRRYIPGPVPNEYNALITFSSGAVGVLQSSYVTGRRIFRVEFHGRNGTAYIDADRESAVVFDDGELETRPSRDWGKDGGAPGTSSEHWLGFWHENRHFIDCVPGGAPADQPLRGCGQVDGAGGAHRPGRGGSGLQRRLSRPVRPGPGDDGGRLALPLHLVGRPGDARRARPAGRQGGAPGNLRPHPARQPAPAHAGAGSTPTARRWTIRASSPGSSSASATWSGTSTWAGSTYVIGSLHTVPLPQGVVSAVRYLNWRAGLYPAYTPSPAEIDRPGLLRGLADQPGGHRPAVALTVLGHFSLLPDHANPAGGFDLSAESQPDAVAAAWLDEVIALCRRFEIAIELNSKSRVPPEGFVRRALELGATFSLGSDAQRGPARRGRRLRRRADTPAGHPGGARPQRPVPGRGRKLCPGRAGRAAAG